jgi:hypothetical protein
VIVVDPADPALRPRADAMARGMRAEGIDADVVLVDDAGAVLPGEYDLLVLGTANHHLSMTPAIHRLLAGLPKRGLEDRYGFAFDERPPYRPGHAASTVEGYLRRIGLRIAQPHVTAPRASLAPASTPVSGATVETDPWFEQGRQLVRAIRHEDAEDW